MKVVKVFNQVIITQSYQAFGRLKKLLL